MFTYRKDRNPYAIDNEINCLTGIMISNQMPLSRRSFDLTSPSNMRTWVTSMNFSGLIKKSTRITVIGPFILIIR